MTLERASHVSNIEELELRSLELDQISALHLDTLFSGTYALILMRCREVSTRIVSQHSTDLTPPPRLPGRLPAPDARKLLRALGQVLFALDRASGAEQRPLDALHHEKVRMIGARFRHVVIGRMICLGLPVSLSLSLLYRSCSPLSMTSLISMSALFSSSLTSLELSSCKLARQAGIILGQSLPSCRALRRLVLADNNLRDGGLRAIVDTLKGMFAIEPIQAICKDCDEDEEDEDLEGWTGLDELDISRNGVTAAGFSAFSHVPVSHLNASENAIEGIGPFLLTNASIQSLNLSGNALSDDGARELISTLFRDQTSLESLDLRGCALSGTSMSFLRKTLRQSTYCSLKVLELDQVSDGPAGDHVERRQCLDEIVQVGSQKYPHLKVWLSKAAPALLSLQENQRHPGARGEATKQPSASITGTEVLPLDTTELREAVATIVSSVAAAPGAQETSQPSHSPAKRVLQSQPQQQHFPVTPSALSSLPSAQHITKGGSNSSSLAQHVQLQHVDVEYIVSKTIECMNQNFEQRLGLFLMKMESQQHDKVRPWSSQTVLSCLPSTHVVCLPWYFTRTPRRSSSSRPRSTLASVRSRGSRPASTCSRTAWPRARRSSPSSRTSSSCSSSRCGKTCSAPRRRVIKPISSNSSSSPSPHWHPRRRCRS